MVKNALPGQTIEFLVNKKRKGKCDGLLSGNPAICSGAGRDPLSSFWHLRRLCVQSIPYEQQLEIKEQQVKELLDSVCSDYVFEGIKGSPIVRGIP